MPPSLPSFLRRHPDLCRNTGRKPRPRRPLARLLLEALESRLAPAVVSWDGGGSDFNWHNPLNWTGDAVPGSGDDAVIDVPGGTITVVASTAAVGIRSLTCDENLTLGGSADLTLTAGV